MTSPDKPIYERLRSYDSCHDRDVDEAADMLEFFLEQMQVHSLQMDGQHRYRFRNAGWPWTHCRGPSKEEAVHAAILEIKSSREENT